jgi:UDP-N-acetylglucosamine:LPS N-acetylglucosamine transferase
LKNPERLPILVAMGDTHSTSSDNPMIEPQRVLILSAPVGAGHDAAARAVREQLEQRGAKVDVDDGLALLRLSRIVVDGYHFQILHAAWSWRWMYRASRSPRLIRLLGWWLSRRRADRLLERIGCDRYDRVVSAYPLVSAALAGLRRRGRLPIPCSTLITDFDPHPGWLHPDLDQNLAVGHAVPGVDLIQPPVSHSDTPILAREQVRSEFGIAPDARVVLIVGGAWGVGNLAGAARVVDAMHGFHAIVVAGRNESLARQLGSDRSLSNVSVVGWTERMAELMAASDVLIQNAGGVTCLEAFSVRLPVVMFDPLPGHGEDNARHMARDGTIVLAAREHELGRLLADDGYWRDAAPACCGRAQSLFERPTVADAIAQPQPPVRLRRARPARTVVRLAVAMALVAGVLEAGHAGEEMADGGASPPHLTP